MTLETKKKFSEEALKTEEILSVIKKTNNQFIKEKEISSKISNEFTKSNLLSIAKNNNLKKNIGGEKKNKTSSEKDKLEVDISQKQSLELKKNKKQTHDQVIKPNIPVKKYTEAEANKKAKKLADKYYYYGYNLGVKNVKKELSTGKDSVAISLKNTIDNIFLISEDYSKKLNKVINEKIKIICEEVIGYEIESNTENFIKKIETLSRSISKSISESEIILSIDDFNIVSNFLKKHKPQSTIKLKKSSDLKRGDIIVKSGDLEIEQLFSKKIKLLNDSKIEQSVNKK